MKETRPPKAADEAPVTIPCRDGVALGGHLWPARGDFAGQVIVNAATGVLARYYHRYARFLAGHGYDVLTYDYRGIGESRPARMRGCRYRWRDWGLQDFDAALRFMRARRDGPLYVVGHSVGGFMPGMAESAHLVDRMLAVGGQFAWMGDYTPKRRLGLILKWHVAMPAITALCGYFPGKRLGWLEDLPAGVANEWAFRGPRFERTHPRAERATVVARMASFSAPILSVVVADDEFATLPGVRRTLGYYSGAPRRLVRISPEDYELKAIGHFDLFHKRHEGGFWADSLKWLRTGENPWPAQEVSI